MTAAGAGSTLTVGIAGAGFMGRVHARSARVNGARVLGVSASSESRAHRGAELMGAERAYADSKALVTDPEIDVVHICVPNNLHAELAELALTAGKHVVCEKPLVTAGPDADLLVRLAAERRLVAAVPFVYRYYPMAHEARWRVRQGELGRIDVVHGHYLQNWLASPDASNWRVDADLGGPSRAFADIGSHWCDLVEFVTGDRIAALAARTRIVRPRRPRPAPAERRREFVDVDTEDTAMVQFLTEGNALGSVLVSQTAAGHHNDLTFEILGDRGSARFCQGRADELTLAHPDGVVRTLSRDAARLTSPDAVQLSRLPAGHPQGYQDCFDAFVADVYAAVRTGHSPGRLPTFSDGARMVAMTAAVLQSASASGAWTPVGGAR